MKPTFPRGVWPTMITPFNEDNFIDYASLEKLIHWYMDCGVQGLFAVCQSSEMFYLSPKEKYELAKFVNDSVSGQLPVIASGHTSDDIKGSVADIINIADSGVYAVILLTNSFAKPNEGDDIWLQNMDRLLNTVPTDIRLGLYECPHPYKRLMTPELLKWCADTNRFYFLKETSGDIEAMELKIKASSGTPLRIYNAVSATLVESLDAGSAGYSGVMANFHPDLYVWLIKNWGVKVEYAKILSCILSLASLLDKDPYPQNAKYYLFLENLINTVHSRCSNISLNSAQSLQIDKLRYITKLIREKLLHV